MAFSNQPLDSSNIPIANVYVADSGFVATQGSNTVETDGLGNNFTPVNVNIHQVNETVLSNPGGDDASGNALLKVLGALRNSDGGYDEPRNNQDNITLVNANSVTTLQNSTVQTNFNGRGAIIVFNMIDASASPSVTCAVYGYEPVTGVAWTILSGLPITANGVYVYRVYPGLTASPNATANDILPRSWGVWGIANNANSATYKICAVIML